MLKKCFVCKCDLTDSEFIRIKGDVLVCPTHCYNVYKSLIEKTQLEIEDLIPYINSKTKTLLFNPGTDEWVRGRVVGIDLPLRKIKLAVTMENDDYFVWIDLYWQLNTLNPRIYKIKEDD